MTALEIKATVYCSAHGYQPKNKLDGGCDRCMAELLMKVGND